MYVKEKGSPDIRGIFRNRNGQGLHDDDRIIFAAMSPLKLISSKFASFFIYNIFVMFGECIFFNRQSASVGQGMKQTYLYLWYPYFKRNGIDAINKLTKLRIFCERTSSI
jgi:hypothetical protein